MPYARPGNSPRKPALRVSPCLAPWAKGRTRRIKDRGTCTDHVLVAKLFKSSGQEPGTRLTEAVDSTAFNLLAFMSNLWLGWRLAGDVTIWARS